MNRDRTRQRKWIVGGVVVALVTTLTLSAALTITKLTATTTPAENGQLTQPPAAPPEKVDEAEARRLADVRDSDQPCTCKFVFNSEEKLLEVEPGKQVVLLIHGIFQDHKTWGKGDSRTIAGALDNNPGFAVGRFDYGDINGDTGGTERAPQAHHMINGTTMFVAAVIRLKTAIACLAEKSGRKIILVGYSKGGLVAQGAITGILMTPWGMADKVEGLVSIGTPWGIRNNALPWVAPIFKFAWQLTSPIPSSVPVMPVGANIHSKNVAVNLGPQGGRVDTPKTTYTEGYRRCPFSVRELRLDTLHGDGCFEHTTTLAPEAESVVNALELPCTDDRLPVVPAADPGGGPYKTMPIDLAGEDPCKKFAHGNLQKNEEIMPRVTPLLERWRASAAKTARSASSGCSVKSNIIVPPPGSLGRIPSVVKPSANPPINQPSNPPVDPPSNPPVNPPTNPPTAKPPALKNIVIKRVWTRDSSSKDQTAFKCGDQVRLSLSVENPNAEAITAELDFLAETDGRRLYYYEQTINILPGLANYESPFTLPIDADGSAEYVADVFPEPKELSPSDSSSNFTINCSR